MINFYAISYLRKSRRVGCMIFAPVCRDACRTFSWCFKFIINDAISASSVYEISSFNAVCEFSRLFVVISNLLAFAPNVVISVDRASAAVSKVFLKFEKAEESKVSALSVSLNDTMVENILLS